MKLTWKFPKIESKAWVEVLFIAIACVVFYYMDWYWWIPLAFYFTITILFLVATLIVELWRRRLRKKNKNWIPKDEENDT